MTLPLSVNLMPDGPVAELVELAEHAERLGLSRCWLYDEGLATRDVYVTLAAIASRTDAIGLGPGITNPYVRHPGATATAVATLDELSGGRACVGIGAGGGLTLDPMAIERRRPARSVEQMVMALRRLFAGETVDMSGEVFSFRAARLDYARPGIEISLAGRGPRLMELGGRIADGFNLSYVHKGLLGGHVAALRAGAREAGRRLLVTYSTMIVTTAAELDEARAALSFRLVDSPSDVREAIGMTEADIAAIRAALRDGGPRAAAAHVAEAWLPHFVIVGSPDEAGAELRRLMSDHEIDEFQLPVLESKTAGPLLERAAALLTPPEAPDG